MTTKITSKSKSLSTRKQKAMFKNAVIMAAMWDEPEFFIFYLEKYPRAAKKRRNRVKWANRVLKIARVKRDYLEKSHRLMSRLERSPDETRGEFFIPAKVMPIVEICDEIERQQKMIGETRLIIPKRPIVDGLGCIVIPTDQLFGFDQRPGGISFDCNCQAGD